MIYSVTSHAYDAAVGMDHGRSNQNLILITCLYDDEFPVDEIPELAANIIAELMYTQYHDNRNGYLLLEPFVDHRKDDSALSVENQKGRVKGKVT